FSAGLPCILMDSGALMYPEPSWTKINIALMLVLKILPDPQPRDPSTRRGWWSLESTKVFSTYILELPVDPKSVYAKEPKRVYQECSWMERTFVIKTEIKSCNSYGVDINTGGIIDTFANFVWEPTVVKINAINATTEAACLILSVDETVKNPKVSRRVHKEMLLLERWVEGMAGQVSVAVEGECEGVELFGFEDAKDFLE
ncbi:hypothetical protein IFM89_004858, partial [Coptis chinensis]